MAGRKLVERGGNGKLTRPQLLIHEATGMEMEFVVNTSPIRALMPGLPKHYKLDLANPVAMVAVEVDGRSHKSPAGRDRDARKNRALEALGWCVLRFWNQEVDENLPGVVEKIHRCIASR